MDTLIVVTAVVVIVGGIVSWWLDDRALSRLRASHPGIWEALGSPNRVFDDLGMAYSHAVDEFCRRSDYHAQCSVELVKWAAVARTYRRCYTIAAIGSIMLMAFIVWRST